MKTKVYYADTDAAGVVYYANYLRWMEMARCDFVDGLGTTVVEYARRGFSFTVARVEIDYRSPALLGDEVEIETTVKRVRHVRFTVAQCAVRPADECELATAITTLACVSPEGKLQTLPSELADQLRRRIS